MSYKQNVEENLAHFAQSIGLGELSLNEHDACGLCFDDSLIVNMEYLQEDEALVFVSSVKPMDAHDEAKISIYEKLLSLNLQHHSMQGAFHALNHEKSEILLLRSTSASSDYGSFETTLEKFVNTLEWVISEIDNTDSDGTADPKSGSTPPPAGNPDEMGMMV